MKIAIIGSGVSGLSTAYLLSPHHQITIFEKDSRIGGHAHTINVKENGEDIAVDNGFMVFNPEKYPNFIKILDELEIESYVTTMSFGVNIPGEISYNSDLPNGIFADKKNIFNVRFLQFLKENIRFRKVAKASLQDSNLANQTLNQFIEKHNFSNDLVNWFLFPMLSAIWSIQDVNKTGEFPALSTLRFLDNHKLLNNIGPKWRTIKGGSVKYVNQIREHIVRHGAEINLNSNISEIKRRKNSVIITCNNKKHTFDRVVFATHADTTKNLLTDITNKEKTALEKFSYSTNVTVLHKDTRLLPANKRLLSAWNYTIVENSKQKNLSAVFTYCMNILQDIPFSTPMLVTLNPHMKIDQNKIYHVEEYTHPIYNNSSIVGQKLISELQGDNGTYFTGAHLGYGFHEDGVTSAVTVAKLFGVEL